MGKRGGRKKAPAPTVQQSPTHNETSPGAAGPSARPGDSVEIDPFMEYPELELGQKDRDYVVR